MNIVPMYDRRIQLNG